ncbi:hypothetical protein BT96DRAFT_415417 [Gymnopus androsaceus JB14]|uniref:F-box domain-containing protein n=1 Tax=Gymnopus androsaceus JB14 TaxID=1447944 RepID=A0A6A4GVE0_9AGAR|nr:hypothetical protein BT96DRAFT_415417 [Gymnopus androsaceus JB14]
MFILNLLNGFLFFFSRLFKLRGKDRPSSYISRLPVEILSTILALSRPESLTRRFDGPASPSITPKQDEFPALFVSRHWRATSKGILNIKPFPVYLNIFLASHNNASIRKHINSIIKSRLRDYLQHSVPASLSFHVHQGGSRSDEVPIAILKLLCEHSEHWENVSLHLLPGDFHSIRNDLDSLPLLKSLELQDTTPRNLHPILTGAPALLPCFSSAPALRTLMLKASILCDPPINMPWSQLTNITISFCNPRDFYLILASCDNISECALKGYDRSSINWTPPVTPLSHFTVQKLALTNCNLAHFLPLLHAPNVKELYSDCAIFDTADAQSINTLPSLHEARLRWVHVEDRLLFKVLGSIRVAKLDLELVLDMPKRGFFVLQTKPRLQHLSIKFRNTTDEAGLIRMITRKMSRDTLPGQRLLSLHIEAHLSLKTIEQLTELWNSGTAITGLRKCRQLAEQAKAYARTSDYAKRRARRKEKRLCPQAFAKRRD